MIDLITEINSILENYKHTTSYIDALQLNKSGALEELKVNPEVNQFYFMANSQSSRNRYTVYVREAKAGLKCTCSCPASKNTHVCKHCLAALIQLKINVTHNYTPDVFDQNSNPLKIVDGITSKMVSDAIHNDSVKRKKANKIINSNGIKQVIIEGNECTCEVKDEKIKHRVHFKRPDTELLITSCTCQETDTPICSHKFAVLYALAVSTNEPYYFNQLLNLDEEKNALLARFGYSLKDDYSKSFTFTFEKNKISLIVKDPALQMVSDAKSWKNNLLSFRQSTEFMLNLEVVNEDDPEPILAFAFFKNFHAELVVVPVLGKPSSKRGVPTLKNIKELHDLASDDLTALKQDDLSVLKILNQADGDTALKAAKKVFGNYTPSSSEQGLFIQQFKFDKMIKLHALWKQYPLFLCSSTHRLSSNTLTPAVLDDRRLDLKFIFREEKELLILESYFFISGGPELSINNIHKSAAHPGQEALYPPKIEKEIIDKYDKYWDDYDDEDDTADDDDQFPINDYYFLHENRMHFHGSVEHASRLRYFYLNPITKVHRSGLESFLSDVIIPVSKDYHVDFKINIKMKKDVATSPLAKVYLSELDNFMLIRPAIRYEQKEVELLDQERILKKEAEEIINYERQKEFEDNIRELFCSIHPNFKGQMHRKMFYIKFSDVLKDGWFFDFFEKLKEYNVEVLGYNKIKRINYNQNKPAVQVSSNSGTDWFDLTVNITYGSLSVKLKDVRKAFAKGEEYIKLSDGTLGILPVSWLNKMASALQIGEITGDKIRVSKIHFSLVDELFEQIGNQEILKEIADKKLKLMEFESLIASPPPLPAEVTLRPYQTAAFHWMGFLDEFGWGGCLADDMGLGKTLQMLTFLKHQSSIYPTTPSLVVMPATLVFNWRKEIEKFFPDLRLLVVYGGERSKDTSQFTNYDVIITTYGMLARDIDHLRHFRFNYVVLDESQAIKNPHSQRYKSVRLLSARNRLAMTGTPIENNTFDLYAQMSFVNPGLLGNMEFFKTEFSDPIDRKGDAQAAEKLRKLIKPFMLRRTKEQVARELPDKTEAIMYCEMEEEQRKVYTAFRDGFRDKIMNKIEVDGLGKSSMVVLDALLKLRQICNSPALLNIEESYGHDSVKLRELMRHILEKTGNHKILVFSQFVQMLKLVEKEIQTAGICYEYLDGKTKNREERVQRFREDNGCRIFLISLKAGGTGLNLVEADYVFLIDPWWNPAVEAQAIDRTHRIGQTKKVIAYKMICRDTIEEKVLQLQEKKKTVARELISTEASFMKQLGKEDIRALFE